MSSGARKPSEPSHADVRRSLMVIQDCLDAAVTAVTSGVEEVLDDVLAARLLVATLLANPASSANVTSSSESL